MKIAAGGLYGFLVTSYLVLVVFDSIRSGEFTLLQSRGIWYVLMAVGTVVVSAWLGFSEGGLLVTGAVGLVPGIAFGTVGTALDMFGLNNPDVRIWAFSGVVMMLGLLLAAFGFAVGKAIQTI